MNERTIRWGILGTAGIARKNWMAIHHSGNGQVRAVASRDVGRARVFIEECQREARFEPAPIAMGSYDALVASPEVDAVYVPLPTGLRKDWVIRAAEAGKHVVCEKPCAVSTQDLIEMIEACRRNRVQFMDGVMFMHSRRLDRMREALKDTEAIGEIRRIVSGFSFFAGESFFQSNIRADPGLEPHGCIGDLGWYCIRFSLWAMDERLPAEVRGRIHSLGGGADGSRAVPTEVSGEMLYEGGVSASFYCSFRTENQQWAHVSGSRGSLSVADFVLPFYGCDVGFNLHRPFFRVSGCRFNMEPHARRVDLDEYSNNHPNAQETHLFRNFAAQVLTGRLNDDWTACALRTQQVMEACLESARRGGVSVVPG